VLKLEGDRVVSNESSTNRQAAAPAPSGRVTIAARSGASVALRAGQSLRVVNTHGAQVVDLWAFVAGSTEYLSMPHSVVTLGRIKPLPGDCLVSELREPLLELVEDQSPGTHCMLFAACDPARYRLLGAAPGHANCADNLRVQAAARSIALTSIPTPLNLFMNTRFTEHRTMTVEAPQARAGDSVQLRALRALTVVMSACAQDLLPVNGHDCTPQQVAFEVID